MFIRKRSARGLPQRLRNDHFARLRFQVAVENATPRFRGTLQKQKSDVRRIAEPRPMFALAALASWLLVTFKSMRSLARAGTFRSSPRLSPTVSRHVVSPVYLSRCALVPERLHGSEKKVEPLRQLVARATQGMGMTGAIVNKIVASFLLVRYALQRSLEEQTPNIHCSSVHLAPA